MPNARTECSFYQIYVLKSLMGNFPHHAHMVAYQVVCHAHHPLDRGPIRHQPEQPGLTKLKPIKSQGSRSL